MNTCCLLRSRFVLHESVSGLQCGGEQRLHCISLSRGEVHGRAA